ncbi:MAG: DNA polymerase III subunit delta [Coriobacteriia bacterium]|nr:DNA polymerase III subunit delta [Coriobacteriia bacterium]
MEDLKPAYLIIGTDKLKRKKVLDRLNTRLSEHGDMSMNTSIFDGDDTDAIISACNTIPFVTDIRYVQVNNAEKLKSDQIISYLENPTKTTILTLICDKLNKNSKLYKSIDKSCIINCEAPKKYMIADQLCQLHNIEKAAAERLVELLGEDTLLLDSQIKKILIATENKKITINDVNTHVSKSVASKPWDFTNAFAARDLKTALNTFHSMDNGSEYILLPMTCTRIKELIGTKTVGEQNLGLQNWQVKNHYRWANNYTMDELKNILNLALDCEVKMKSTSDSAGAFELFIIEAIK